MRRLITGDIHSSYTKLRKALDRAGFRKDEDVLYSTGDLADRGSEVCETFDYLLSLPRFYPVLGNHDLWLYEYLKLGIRDDSFRNWVKYNGGSITVLALSDRDYSYKLRIRTMLSKARLAIAEDDFIIVHGGIPAELIDTPIEKLTEITADDLILTSQFSPHRKVTWDRGYLMSAAKYEKTATVTQEMLPPIRDDRKLFVGHTPTDGKVFASKYYRLTDMDTGSAKSDGLISVMDIDTGEVWQSG